MRRSPTSTDEPRRARCAVRHVRDQLVSFGVETARLQVIPYGVGECEQILSPDDRRAIELIRTQRRAGGFVLCCAGAIGARNNQRAIVDALALLRDQPDILAIFVGDGETAPLQQRIDAAGLGDRARLVGDTPAARRLAREADALVLASRREDDSLAISKPSATVPSSSSTVARRSPSWWSTASRHVGDAESAAAFAATMCVPAGLMPDDRRAIDTRARAVRVGVHAPDDDSALHPAVSTRSPTAGQRYAGPDSIRPARSSDTARRSNPDRVPGPQHLILRHLQRLTRHTPGGRTFKVARGVDLPLLRVAGRGVLCRLQRPAAVSPASKDARPGRC